MKKEIEFSFEELERGYDTPRVFKEIKGKRYAGVVGVKIPYRPHRENQFIYPSFFFAQDRAEVKWWVEEQVAAEQWRNHRIRA